MRDNELLRTIDVAAVFNVTDDTVRNYMRLADRPLAAVKARQGLRTVYRFERGEVAAFAAYHGLETDWSKVEG